MNVVFKESNFNRIESMIKEIEGRSTERRLNVDDINYALKEVENRFHVKKKYMKGVKVEVDIHAQHFPRGYKWTPMSTHFEAEHTGTYWKIIAIYRSRCRDTMKKFNVYAIPPDTRMAVIGSLLSF